MFSKDAPNLNPVTRTMPALLRSMDSLSKILPRSWQDLGKERGIMEDRAKASKGFPWILARLPWLIMDLGKATKVLMHLLHTLFNGKYMKYNTSKTCL